MIYACGPTPMLKAIKEYALEKGIECQLSLEERMACGSLRKKIITQMLIIREYVRMVRYFWQRRWNFNEYKS